ncbi:hypothetical protein D3C85_1499670 [compost metagenome]
MVTGLVPISSAKNFLNRNFWSCRFFKIGCVSALSDGAGILRLSAVAFSFCVGKFSYDVIP